MVFFITENILSSERQKPAGQILFIYKETKTERYSKKKIRRVIGTTGTNTLYIQKNKRH